MPAQAKHNVAPDASESLKRARYEELRDLRETKPEREAARMMKAMERSRETSEALICELRSEVARHRKNEAAMAQSASHAEKLQKENKLLREKLANTQTGKEPFVHSNDASHQVIKFYEMLTGMNVRLEGEKWICNLSAAAEDSKEDDAADAANHKSVSFHLDMAPEGGESGEVGYAPTNLTNAGSRLPEYLRDEITFDQTLAPAFLQKLLAGITASSDDE